MEVGCQALLQGIFLTQGSNLCLLHCRHILYLWATRKAQFLFLMENCLRCYENRQFDKTTLF